MTIPENLVDNIAYSLHTTATQKTDARAAKKIISMVVALDSAEVAESVLTLVREDKGVRDYLPQWSTNVKDQSKLRENIFMSAELIDLIKPPFQTELITKHLGGMHKAFADIEELKPYIKDFSSAPAKIREKLVNVVRTAVSLELALKAEGLKLEFMALSWYRFVYFSFAHASLVREIILSSVKEGKAEESVDAVAIKKKFDSPANRVKRAKNIISNVRGAAEAVEYNKEMKFQEYLQKVQEKSVIAR